MCRLWSAALPWELSLLLCPRSPDPQLTDTSPRMVKCRLFSLSTTASPSSGEKVGEQLHSTGRREAPMCHIPRVRPSHEARRDREEEQTKPGDPARLSKQWART